jgi:hypothetical protein
VTESSPGVVTGCRCASAKMRQKARETIILLFSVQATLSNARHRAPNSRLWDKPSAICRLSLSLVTRPNPPILHGEAWVTLPGFNLRDQRIDFTLSSATAPDGLHQRQSEPRLSRNEAKHAPRAMLTLFSAIAPKVNPHQGQREYSLRLSEPDSLPRRVNGWPEASGDGNRKVMHYSDLRSFRRTLGSAPIVRLNEHRALQPHVQ